MMTVDRGTVPIFVDLHDLNKTKMDRINRKCNFVFISLEWINYRITTESDLATNNNFSISNLTFLPLSLPSSAFLSIYSEFKHFILFDFKYMHIYSSNLEYTFLTIDIISGLPLHWTYIYHMSQKDKSLIYEIKLYLQILQMH